MLRFKRYEDWETLVTEDENGNEKIYLENHRLDGDDIIEQVDQYVYKNANEVNKLKDELFDMMKELPPSLAVTDMQIKLMKMEKYLENLGICYI